MTDQKSLKRLVRERMSRTGESYTTAHRQVSARRADPQETGLVAGYPAFGAEAHHPSALARHLLGAAGIEVSEAMACGLGGGVGFLYAVFEYGQVDHPLLTIVAQHHPMPWLSAVAESLGLELDTVHSTSGPAARRKLDALLDDGKPALMTVARGLLPHHPEGSPMEAADPYQVVVAGRRDDDYLVDDVSPTPHVVSGADLVEAWAGHRKGRFELTTIVGPDPVTDAALDRGIRAAVRMTVDHLTGPVLGNSFDVNVGFSGMRKLVTELRDGSTKHGWRRRFATPAQAAYAGGRLSECLTTAHTAPGATRPLYGRFLAEAADRPGAPDLSAAAGLFVRSGQGWTALAEEAAVSPADFSSFADRVEDCLRLEEQAVERIREALAGS